MGTRYTVSLMNEARRQITTIKTTFSADEAFNVAADERAKLKYNDYLEISAFHDGGRGREVIAEVAAA